MIRLLKICNQLHFLITFHIKGIDYNYNYLQLVINYVIDYFCNRLLYNTAEKVMDLGPLIYDNG